ncbi:D-aminoacyl-tRNA deacylase [Capnocytophaga sp. ARDL2]|uniref:D-aminoacyl-tRNA deacylase n=1 Tax=Capnocytophaga sp. ARDL2 TaxID=3238809 RepID=UPI003558A692
MRVVVQRVSSSSVEVEDKMVGKISKGLLLLLGVENKDTIEDIDWLVKKIVNMRIFSDENGKMNRSVKDVQGEFLVISQFTLFASTKKGNRPSFIKAATPNFANQMYEMFVERLRGYCHLNVEKGIFGADMKVQLLNDGPVTIIVDTKNKE